MIIGEHAPGNDIGVNPIKGKQLTNIRASGTDDAVSLTTPIEMTLDKAISDIDDAELVEVRPKSARLRKRSLNPRERKPRSRRKKAE